MEEDIKEILTALDNITKKQLDKAIANADKEWSKMELEEDIKYLEDLIPFAKMLLTTSQRATIQEKEIEVLENIIARYKEVKEENKKMKANNLLKLNKEINENIQVAYGGRRYNTEGIVIENYILKSKVKEKIDSKFKEAKGLYERGVQPQAQFTMKLLRDLEKELLEES